MTASHITIPTRRLGDLEVSAVGLGLMGMSFGYGPVDAAGTEEALATIHQALDDGVTLLDTAEMYAGGENERLLAQVLETRRDEVVVATKFGIVPDPETGMPNGVDGSPENVRRAIDGSLQRLGIDHVDLYYQHRIDPAVPIEDTVGAMAELVAAGKVRHLGLSEPSGETLRRAVAVHPIAAVQSEWSLFSRDIESDVVPVARELGVGLVPYSPLGRGMLTGSAASIDVADGDFRSTLPRWQADAVEENRRQVAVIERIAQAHDATAAQVALAWVLARGDDVVPIPGTRRRSYLLDNLRAVRVQLTDADLAVLSGLRAAGTRYPDMGWVAGRSA